jgi:hypothetical protein
MMRLNRAGWLFFLACQGEEGAYLGKGVYHLRWWFSTRGYIEDAPEKWKERITTAGREALLVAAAEHSRHGRTIGRSPWA